MMSNDSLQSKNCLTRESRLRHGQRLTNTALRHASVMDDNDEDKQFNEIAG